METSTARIRGTARPRRVVPHLAAISTGVLAAFSGACLPAAAGAQEPVAWGSDLVFATFSIAAVDLDTRETGVAVTTRVPCVGNGVPWVRAGVGAVATQASTRTEYGNELLDLLGTGLSPEEALAERLASDPLAERRQVAVISVDGRSAQHTGDRTSLWRGHQAGANYVAQGNTLTGPEVIEAVARTFEASEGSGRHLADRLIDALAAGQAAGGDARRGRSQSAAVIVADPRPGVARRPDGVTVHINVCEHPEPVDELRRIHDAISQTLGYRTLEMQAGQDVWQLKVILHALGFFRPEEPELPRGRDATLYTPDAVAGVDAFRAAHGLSTPDRGGSPPGLVDAETVELLWRELEEAGKAETVRALLRETTQIRR